MAIVIGKPVPSNLLITSLNFAFSSPSGLRKYDVIHFVLKLTEVNAVSQVADPKQS